MTYHAFLTLHTISAEDTARSIHTGIYCGIYIFTRLPFHLNSCYRRTSFIGRTFFFMEMLGFSINMLTLFALVLAIGIVVDNAIVVVEAVHVKMHHEKLSPYKASVAAINEIGGAIIAITLVMSAVFVPSGLHAGNSRYFLSAILIDTGGSHCYLRSKRIDSLACLCALLLKPAEWKKKKKQDATSFLYFLQPSVRPL